MTLRPTWLFLAMFLSSTAGFCETNESVDDDSAARDADETSGSISNHSQPATGSDRDGLEQPEPWGNRTPRYRLPEDATDRAGTTDRRWYGGSIIPIDLISIGTGVLGLVSLTSNAHEAQDVGAALLLGAGTAYVLGGPIVHAAHGRPGISFASLGLRVGVPVTGAMIGGIAGAGATQGCSGEWCGLGGVVVGGLLGFSAGMLTASLIDINVLAYERANDTPSPTVALVPVVDPKRGSAGLGVMGTW